MFTGIYLEKEDTWVSLTSILFILKVINDNIFDDDDDEGLYDLPYDSKKSALHNNHQYATPPAGKLRRQQKIVINSNNNNNWRSDGAKSIGGFTVGGSVDNLASIDDVDESKEATHSNANHGSGKHENIYQNSLKLLDEIEYIDTSLLHLRKIQSRPDASSGHIVVEHKSPMPIPRHNSRDGAVTSPLADDSNGVSGMTSSFDLQQNGGAAAGNTDSLKRRSLDKKDIGSPMLLGNHHFMMKDRKVIPVKPNVLQRPKSNGGLDGVPLMPPQTPTKPTHSKRFVAPSVSTPPSSTAPKTVLDNNNIGRIKSVGSHGNQGDSSLTTELKTRVKAVKAVPSLTAVHQDGNWTLEGRPRYENNNINFK